MIFATSSEDKTIHDGKIMTPARDNLVAQELLTNKGTFFGHDNFRQIWNEAEELLKTSDVKILRMKK